MATAVPVGDAEPTTTASRMNLARIDPHLARLVRAVEANTPGTSAATIPWPQIERITHGFSRLREADDTFSPTVWYDGWVSCAGLLHPFVVAVSKVGSLADARAACEAARKLCTQRAPLLPRIYGWTARTLDDRDVGFIGANTAFTAARGDRVVVVVYEHSEIAAAAVSVPAMTPERGLDFVAALADTANTMRLAGDGRAAARISTKGCGRSTCGAMILRQLSFGTTPDFAVGMMASDLRTTIQVFDLVHKLAIEVPPHTLATFGDIFLALAEHPRYADPPKDKRLKATDTADDARRVVSIPPLAAQDDDAFQEDAEDVPLQFRGACSLRVTGKCVACQVSIASAGHHLHAAECNDGYHLVCPACVDRSVAATVAGGTLNLATLPCCGFQCDGELFFDDYAALVQPRTLQTWCTASRRKAVEDVAATLRAGAGAAAQSTTERRDSVPGRRNRLASPTRNHDPAFAML